MLKRRRKRLKRECVEQSCSSGTTRACQKPNSTLPVVKILVLLRIIQRPKNTRKSNQKRFVGRYKAPSRVIKPRRILCQLGQKLGIDEMEDLEVEPGAGSSEGEMEEKEVDRSKRLSDEDDQLGSRKRLRYAEPLRSCKLLLIPCIDFHNLHSEIAQETLLNPVKEMKAPTTRSWMTTWPTCLTQASPLINLRKKMLLMLKTQKLTTMSKQLRTIC